MVPLWKSRLRGQPGNARGLLRRAPRRLPQRRRPRLLGPGVRMTPWRTWACTLCPGGVEVQGNRWELDREIRVHEDWHAEELMRELERVES